MLKYNSNTNQSDEKQNCTISPETIYKHSNIYMYHRNILKSIENLSKTIVYPNASRIRKDSVDHIIVKLEVTDSIECNACDMWLHK